MLIVCGVCVRDDRIFQDSEVLGASFHDDGRIKYPFRVGRIRNPAKVSRFLVVLSKKGDK